MNIQQKFETSDRFAFGFEPEFYGKSYTEMNRFNSGNNKIKGLSYKYDGSAGVSAEMNFPPLLPCDRADDFIKRSLEQVKQFSENKVTWRCGLHMHLSTLPVRQHLTNDQFTALAIEMVEGNAYWYEDTRNLGQLFDLSSQVPLEIYKDVGYRMSKHRDFFHSTISKSRRDDGGTVPNNTQPNGYFCRMPITDLERIKNCPANIDSLRRVLTTCHHSYKYSAINVSPYNSKKTVEFRSHQGSLELPKMITWYKFISNMVNHSLQNRFKADRMEEQITSPSYIGRSDTTIKSRLWNFCRVAGGRSTRDIMSHCDISCPQSVRRTISEIRSNENYEPFIVTHNQQEYGTRYGSSDEYGNNGYEILINANRSIVGNDLKIITDNLNRGKSNLTESLDGQSLADLNERIRQLS